MRYKIQNKCLEGSKTMFIFHKILFKIREKKIVPKNTQNDKTEKNMLQARLDWTCSLAVVVKSNLSYKSLVDLSRSHV